MNQKALSNLQQRVVKILETRQSSDMLKRAQDKGIAHVHLKAQMERTGFSLAYLQKQGFKGDLIEFCKSVPSVEYTRDNDARTIEESTWWFRLKEDDAMRAYKREYITKYARIVAKNAKTKETFRKEIVQNFKNDTMISMERIKLTDPLVMSRLDFPVIGKNCAHLQPFDGLKYMEAKFFSKRVADREWKCPICMKEALWKDLHLNMYWLEVLKSKKAKHCDDVVVNSDGSWKPQVEREVMSLDSDSDGGDDDDDDGAVDDDSDGCSYGLGINVRRIIAGEPDPVAKTKAAPTPAVAVKKKEPPPPVAALRPIGKATIPKKGGRKLFIPSLPGRKGIPQKGKPPQINKQKSPSPPANKRGRTGEVLKRQPPTLRASLIKPKVVEQNGKATSPRGKKRVALSGKPAGGKPQMNGAPAPDAPPAAPAKPAYGPEDAPPLPPDMSQFLLEEEVLDIPLPPAKKVRCRWVKTARPQIEIESELKSYEKIKGLGPLSTRDEELLKLCALFWHNSEIQRLR